MLLNRVTRSSIIRKVAVEVGDMSKEQTQQTLRRVKELFEQKTSINNNKSMTEYTNPGAVENFIYYAVHNGQGQITVDSVGGDVNVKDLADLDQWVNKFYAAYGIPKQYFGYTDDAAGFNGGSSLAITSSVFAKGVSRIKNALIQALSDLISLYLYDRGYKSYINKFTLKMKAILSQEEKDYRENFSNRVSAISSFLSLFSEVDNKERKLKILKSAVKSLNYDENILRILDEEIADAAKQIEEEREKVRQEAEAAATESAQQEANASAEEADDGLTLSPMPENLTNDSNEILTEAADLDDENNLPTPEELDENKDFSNNLN